MEYNNVLCIATQSYSQGQRSITTLGIDIFTHHLCLQLLMLFLDLIWKVLEEKEKMMSGCCDLPHHSLLEMCTIQ